MAETYLDLLPTDIRCELYKYPISLEYFNSLQKDPVQGKLVRECVQILEGEDEGELSSNFVLSLPNIRVISSAYPILVTREALVYLSEKESLREASFNVFPIINQMGGIIGEMYQRIILFFDGYMETHPEFSADCQNCTEQPRYKFIFFYMDQDETIRAVEVSEGGIFLINPKVAPSSDFYDELIKYVPLCEYRGPFNYDTPLEKLGELPCLKRVYFKFDPSYPRLYDLRDTLKGNNVTKYYLSYPKSTDGIIVPKRRFTYNGIISNFIEGLPDTRVYNIVTTFFPIAYYLLPKVNQVFPNLEDIFITLSSLNLYKQGYHRDAFIEAVQKFKRITIVIDLLGAEDDQVYIALFPQQIQNRINLIDSDWLS